MAAAVPQPPEDIEQRNIIDKLAQFVARNGPEFEQMTKQKQANNPNFQFLFGGDSFHYYQYKLTTEQAIQRKQKAQQAAGARSEMSTAAMQQAVIMAGALNIAVTASQHSHASAAANNAAYSTPSTSYDPYATAAPHQDPSQPMPTMQALQAQIRESESNLQAQYSALMQQKQMQIDEYIWGKERADVLAIAQQFGISMDEFDSKLETLKQACTKEAIANTKGWILTNVACGAGDMIFRYTLMRVHEDLSFTFHLHLLYLINDLLHHW